jgi:hypothetical protein
LDSETQDPTDVAEYQQRETNKLIEDGLLCWLKWFFLRTVLVRLKKVVGSNLVGLLVYETYRIWFVNDLHGTVD